MKTRNFRELLEKRWSLGYSVCVGLDSDLDKIPKAARTGLWGMHRSLDTTMVAFNCAIVDATADLVCAYKPNSAFYEAHGGEGLHALRQTIAYINQRAPEVPVILDAKRGDIGNTNEGYVKATFDLLGADAITVHPYLGRESLRPFLEKYNKGIFVLCRTSNPGAEEFQDQLVVGMPLYEYVACKVSQTWNEHNNCGLVVGATHPEELRKVRQRVGNVPILIPGIGAQGGDLEKTVQAGKDSRGRGMIINSSRGIIFASFGPDFAEAARRETIKLHEQITECLKKGE